MKADKKQLLLRLSPSLYEKLMRMAEEDFRSLNGEIEYLLTQAVNKKYPPNPIVTKEKGEI